MTPNTRARPAAPVHPLASMLREAINDRMFVDTDGDIHYCHGLTVDEIEMVISKYESQYPSASPDAQTYKDLVEFARWSQTLCLKGQEIMRREGLVIDNLDDKMQKLAFTFYTDLCEIDHKVAHIFEEGGGDKFERSKPEPRNGPTFPPTGGLNSTELLAVACEEWRCREERHNLHPREHWVAGWLNGIALGGEYLKKRAEGLRQKNYQAGARNGTQT